MLDRSDLGGEEVVLRDEQAGKFPASGHGHAFVEGAIAEGRRGRNGSRRYEVPGVHKT